jgi:hypothetical protein
MSIKDIKIEEAGSSPRFPGLLLTGEAARK